MNLPIEEPIRLARNASSAAKAAFAVYGLSDRGLVRANNEDCWFADGGLGLALAADGVGGHANGARASQGAVRCIADYIRRARKIIGDDGLTPPEMRERIVARAIALANRRLVIANTAVPDARHQCGTTIVGLWAPHGVHSPATLFHVGDSRLYRLRDGRIDAVTRDHSAYQKWCDTGRHGTAPPKSYILQALGLSAVVPDIVSIQVCPGDCFLLCTDGLTNNVADAELEGELAANSALETVCERLVSLGLARGGSDNLTAVCCAFSRLEATP
ncbi:MAG TPA: protein phosphatase 2C domain-containing protein [Micropepsaceae bacterium]|jgi:protein phosphatase